MKASVFILGLGLCSSTAFANGKITMSCVNEDGTTSLRLTQAEPTSFRADVKVESFGGSAPTFHFKNITMISGFVMGQPITYKGNDFLLSLTGEFGRSGTLSIPSLGIKKEQVTCN